MQPYQNYYYQTQMPDAPTSMSPYSSAPLTAPVATPSSFMQQHSLQQSQPAALLPIAQPRPTLQTTYTSGPRAPPREVCRDFTAGKCNRGNTCRFLHVLPHAAAPILPVREACLDYTRGKCNRGAGCKFFHALPPVMSPSPPQMPVTSYFPPPVWTPLPAAYELQGREPCRDFARGGCARGPTCRFLHESIEQPEHCRDYLHGVCDRGNSCRFLHDREVCRDYSNGSCSRGDDCKYLHVKEEVCRDFLNGACARADKCRFIHSRVSPAPDTILPSPEQHGQGGLKRNREEEENDTNNYDNNRPVEEKEQPADIEEQATKKQKIEQEEVPVAEQPGGALSASSTSSASTALRQNESVLQTVSQLLQAVAAFLPK